MAFGWLFEGLSFFERMESGFNFYTAFAKVNSLIYAKTLAIFITLSA